MVFQIFTTPDLMIPGTGAQIKKALKTVPGVVKVSVNSRKCSIEVEGNYAEGAPEEKLKAMGINLAGISPYMDMDWTKSLGKEE